MTTPEPGSSPDPLPAEIAGYRIDRVLSASGMSTVYRAHHPTLPHDVALKVLPAELARDPAIRARFVQEGNTTARLGIPNVVAVYGRGATEDGQLWIAMQYIGGTDAEAALRAAAMTPSRALRIVNEAAKVLDYAHACGVVHQDVKPSNILLGERSGEPERVVLSDFGAAVTPHSGDPAEAPMMVSLAYASPEVIMGQPIDGRADVYSLGCTLFRLLTCQVPFPGHNSVVAIANAHLQQDPPRPSDLLPWATPELDAVIGKAMAKDPDHRYRTAGQLAAAATRAVRGPSPSRPAPVIDTAAPPPRVAVSDTGSLSTARSMVPRRRWIVGGAIAAALLLLALLVWEMLPADDPAPSPTAAGSTTISSVPATPPPPQRLPTRLLPAGYPVGACTPAPPTDAVAASAMTCAANRDRGGPLSATYTLADDAQSLQDALTRVVSTSNTVLCPGNIQSPGPWRRVADPAVPRARCSAGSATINRWWPGP